MNGCSPHALVDSADATKIIGLIQGEHQPFALALRHMAMLNETSLSTINRLTIMDPSKKDLIKARCFKRTYPSLDIVFEKSTKMRQGTQAQCVLSVAALDQLELIADYIIANGLSEEGIFRLIKGLGDPQKLAQRLVADGRVQFKGLHAFVLANMLKCLIRDHLPGMLDEEDIAQIVQTGSCVETVATLTSDRQRFLAILGRVARAVVDKQETTLMDYRNLAICIAPNLYHHEDPRVELALLSKVQEATQILLKSC